ncbi:hypothetical protein ACFFGV_07580 [Pontibacillus salicampi]|uniref:Uncharacterized protein n=1 Tax=Pontibacillus salicampi TaxID=1449801 RepID=A0ABV6LMB0_9BACI
MDKARAHPAWIVLLFVYEITEPCYASVKKMEGKSCQLETVKVTEGLL